MNSEQHSLLHHSLRAAYEPFRSIVSSLWPDGSNLSHVSTFGEVRTYDGIEYNDNLYVIRQYDVTKTPYVLGGFKQRLEALSRGVGRACLEQIVAYDTTDMAIVSAQADGKAVTDLRSTDVPHISQPHIERLVGIIPGLPAIPIDPDFYARDLFFDKSTGFTIVDYEAEIPGVAYTTVDITKGFLKALMKTGSNADIDTRVRQVMFPGLLKRADAAIRAQYTDADYTVLSSLIQQALSNLDDPAIVFADPDLN